MKKVFSNHYEVAHVFAQRKQNEGRAGNMFFEDDTIYSYGKHYPIAKFAKNSKGKVYILLNGEKDSSSTGQHCSIAAQATRQYFSVPLKFSYTNKQDKIRFHHERYRKSLVQEGKALFANPSLKKSGTLRWSAQCLGNVAKKWNDHQSFFDLKPVPFPVSVPDNWEELVRDKEDRESFLATDAGKRRDKRMRKAKVKRIKTIIAEFRGGQRCVVYGYLDGINTMLRVKPSDGETVETSEGATFPLSHARKAFDAINAIRIAGKAWKRNGHAIHCGHFQIDSIDERGNIRAGCHSIKWYEIIRFAKSQDWARGL